MTHPSAHRPAHPQAPPPTARRRGARSRQGGVPTTLPPTSEEVSRAGAVATPGSGAGLGRQLALPIAGAAPRRTPQELLDGVVHIPAWLHPEGQRELVEQFRHWARPPAGLRHPRVPTGHLMSVQSVCLGWHWHPYAYSRTADDTDGAPVKPLPDGLRRLAQRAVAAADAWAGRPSGPFEPDAAIVNLYAPGARLGLHQDGEEPSCAPVVTLSLGDACIFRLAGVERRTGPFTDIELRSGDLLVFGGANRRIFHGVPKVLPGTGPDHLGLPPGRLSITVRETGLA